MKTETLEFKKLSSELEEVLMSNMVQIKGGGSDMGGIDWQALFNSMQEGVTYEFVTDSGGTFLVDDNNNELYEGASGDLYYRVSEDGINWTDVPFTEPVYWENVVTFEEPLITWDWDSPSELNLFGDSDWKEAMQDVVMEYAEDLSSSPAAKVFGWIKSAADLYNLWKSGDDMSVAEFGYNLTLIVVGTANAWAGLGIVSAAHFMEVMTKAMNEGNTVIMNWLQNCMDPTNPDGTNTAMPQEVRDALDQTP